MKASRKSVLALIGAMAMGAAMAAPSVEIVSVQQQYPWTNTVDIVYTVAGVESETNGYFVVFTPTTSTGEPILDVNGEKSVQVALKGSGVYSTQWFPQTNLQYTACKMTPTVFRGSAKDYLIIDLETWEVYYEPMATQADSNKRYNTQEYKTKKLVLRRVEEGDYTIGHSAFSDAQTSFRSRLNRPHTVKVPAGTCYYIGIFATTIGQYNRVLGKAESLDSEMPAMVSWNALRANALPQAAVRADETHASSFLARLSGLTGLSFDLPTSEMWEIAARAKTTTAYFWGDKLDSAYCWSKYTGGLRHNVGEVRPNAWGLYDVSGNVFEWCRDIKISGDLADKTTDIYTPNATGGTNRAERGGDCNSQSDEQYTCSYEGIDGPNANIGFRLSIVFK